MLPLERSQPLFDERVEVLRQHRLQQLQEEQLTLEQLDEQHPHLSLA